jgi:hypothetical protein
MRRWLLLIGCSLAVGNVLAGSGGNSARAAPAMSDPFDYCARIGTIDEPAGGASPVPVALMPWIRIPGWAEVSAQALYWRCMDGEVYVCAVGANLPCAGKADRAKFNAGAESFCRENRNAAAVPAYATGHNSIYSWSCVDGAAVRGKRVVKLDRRGYDVNIWHRVSRKDAG